MPKHTREWRETEDLRVFPAINHGLHLHHRIGTGRNGEAIGPGDTRTVHERVDHTLLRARHRSLDPKLLEDRKLLALRFRGVDRQAARRQPVNRLQAERPKVARPDKRHQLIRRQIETAQHLKTREADRVRQTPADLEAPIVEHITGEFNRLHRGTIELEDLD